MKKVTPNFSILFLTLSLILLATTRLFAVDYLYVAGYGNDQVLLIHPNTQQLLNPPIPVGSDPLGLAVNHAGSKVYVPNFGDDTISIINTQSLSVEKTISLPQGSLPSKIGIHPMDYEFYVVNNGKNSISVINSLTFQIETIPVGTSPTDLVVTPSGQWVYVTNQGNNTVSVINTVNKEVETFNVNNYPTGIAYEPEQDLIFISHSLNANVGVYDAATLQLIKTIPAGQSPQLMTFNYDYSKLYVVNAGNKTLSVIDTDSLQVVKIISLAGDFPSHVTLSQDGSKLYVVSFGDHHIQLVDPFLDLPLANLIESNQLESPARIAVKPTLSSNYPAVMPEGSKIRITLSRRGGNNLNVTFFKKVGPAPGEPDEWIVENPIVKFPLITGNKIELRRRDVDMPDLLHPIKFNYQRTGSKVNLSLLDTKENATLKLINGQPMNSETTLKLPSTVKINLASLNKVELIGSNDELLWDLTAYNDIDYIALPEDPLTIEIAIQ